MTSSYSDYGYSRSGNTAGPDGEALAATYVRIARALDGVRTVCDAGCGNGYIASRLAAEGLAVTGVEASSSGIAIANANYQGPGIRFIQADIASPSDWPAIGGPFDAVVCSDVVEHLYRPASLLEMAHAVLRPAGYLILGTPYHGYLKNLAIALSGRWDSHHSPNWDGGHIKFFSVATLTELVTSRGFSKPRFHFHGRAPLLWKNMICVASRSP
jgi:SAM-dependent methyltransferase